MVSQKCSRRKKFERILHEFSIVVTIEQPDLLLVLLSVENGCKSVPIRLVIPKVGCYYDYLRRGLLWGPKARACWSIHIFFDKFDGIWKGLINLAPFSSGLFLFFFNFSTTGDFHLDPKQSSLWNTVITTKRPSSREIFGGIFVVAINFSYNWLLRHRRGSYCLKVGCSWL